MKLGSSMPHHKDSPIISNLSQLNKISSTDIISLRSIIILSSNLCLILLMKSNKTSKYIKKIPLKDQEVQKDPGRDR